VGATAIRSHATPTPILFYGLPFRAVVIGMIGISRKKIDWLFCPVETAGAIGNSAKKLPVARDNAG